MIGYLELPYLKSLLVWSIIAWLCGALLPISLLPRVAGDPNETNAVNVSANIKEKLYFAEKPLSPNLASLDHTGYIRNRTAVIITGQLRSGNVSFSSKNISANTQFFGEDDPPSVIKTHLALLLKPISEEGGVDVFMFVESVKEDENFVWDGDPLTFKPKEGDPTACRPYADHILFQNTGNRFFCMVENEERLMTQFLAQFSKWKRYIYHNIEGSAEQALRQYYSMYRANLACKQYAIAYNVSYTYKIRLRPDTAIIKPMPSLNTLSFEPRLQQSHVGPHTGCKRAILFPNLKISSHTHKWASDWFIVGHAEDMDHMLDHYLDMTRKDFFGINRPDKFPGNLFNLEYHLEKSLYDDYGVCMQDHSDIWMVYIRLEKQGGINNMKRNSFSNKTKNDWKELSSVASNHPNSLSFSYQFDSKLPYCQSITSTAFFGFLN